MLRVFVTALISASIITLSMPQSASAVETPSFPVCTNPQGNLKVKYDSGTHGIVGNPATYTGSDAVYSVNENQLVQCFCADNGSGIQTNWLKVGQISESERKSYEADGWIYVPNGSLWGLEDTAYVAKNSDYSCKSGGSGSSQGSSSSTGGGVGGPSHQGASVFGLASTGDITTTLAFFISGVTAFLLGLTLRKRA